MTTTKPRNKTIYIVVIILHLLLTVCYSCNNIYQGGWIYDDSYPIYDSLKCPFIDEGLNCIKNGRRDNLYLKYRWQPNQCDLPRFNGEDLLENFRGKRFMFVGDSLSSNMWQSLACMLHAAVPNSNYTFDRTANRYVLSFSEFEFTVTFLKDGFLIDEVVEEAGRVLKLDSLSRGDEWKGVDVLIFNSYHWWIHTGKFQTWDYFQVGHKLYKDMDHMVAYKIALTTWANWIDSNIDPSVTKVFFQGISAIHNHGSDWGEPTVKDCSGQTKPIEGYTYPGERYPGEAIVKSVLSNMTKPVSLLDITLLTQLRKDGHPSSFTSSSTLVDCSHWCVAGVPDAWNELLYTILIQK